MNSTTNSNINLESELIKKLKKTKLNLNEITAFLKNNEIDLNKLDNSGYNALHYAIKAESIQIVEQMLFIPDGFATRPANPNTFTEDSQKDVHISPLHFALLHANDYAITTKIIKLLIKAGGDWRSLDEERCNMLHRAAEKGRIELFEFIINKDENVDLNALSNFGTCLHLAIIGEQEDMIQYLLDKNVDLSLRDRNGNTVLHLALVKGLFNGFKLMLDYITKHHEWSDETKHELLNAVNDEGNTILHELAYAKSSVLIDYILNKLPLSVSTDPKTKNKDGYTYTDIQQNIIKMLKNKEEKEKQKRELIRAEKARLIEERRKAELEHEEEERREQEAEEKRQQMGLFLLKYRGYIFLIVFMIFMFILYLVLVNATKKKPKIIY